MDVGSTYTDASETSPGAINAYFRSGWLDMQQMIENKFIPYVDLSFTSQTTGNFEFKYGYNFSQDSSSTIVNMQAGGDKWGEFLWGVGRWGQLTDLTKLVLMKGKGKYFQYLIRNNNSSEQLKFNGLSVPIKQENPAAFNGT